MAITESTSAARQPSPAGPLRSLDLFAALGVVVIWGLNFVAMKLSLREFTPFQLGLARYVFAVLPLVLIVRRPRIAWPWLVAAGLAQFGQVGLLFLALQLGMTAALASVLMQTQVFFTSLLGLVLLKRRQPQCPVCRRGVLFPQRIIVACARWPAVS